MISNYFKIAWRHILRSKAYSLLNITGLIVSLTAFILMALYIEDELSFDRFNTQAAHIYRVADDKQTPDVLLRSAQTSAPLAPALQQEFPDIKEAVRLIHAEALVKYNDKLFEERNLFYADANLFDVFSFTMLKGNAGAALREPNNVVLTAATANKYFGNVSPVGQILSVDGESMKVTGVMDNVPANSHLQFDFLISMATAEGKGSGYDWLFSNWYSNLFYTYILLPPDYDIGKLASQMAAFDKRHKEANSVTQHRYAFEKLTDIYLRSDRNDQAGKTGNLTHLYIFSVVAVFMLLIACINFINLSTARSSTRAKEVAIRKVAGAGRSQMIGQFLAESFLMIATALVTSLLLAAALLPYFNLFAGKSLSLHLSLPLHIAVIAALLVSTGLLSGIYPAVVLSGFLPVTALKGKVNPSAWNILTRKGLVVFQFTVSVVLIVCSLVVYRQMNYLQQHDLGFASSQTMVINFEGDNHVQQRLDVIRQRLLSIPGVKGITASSNVPGDGNVGSWSADIVKKDGDTIHTELPVYCVDYNYLQQYGIPMVAGKAFSRNDAADSTESMLLNETAVRQMGFASATDAIGVIAGMYPTDGRITGIVKDFHFESLQKAVTPLAIRVIPFKFRLLSVELNGNNIQQTMAAIQSTWKILAPERPLEFSFLDESFNRQYQSDSKFGHVFGIFTVLAIVIACLGLFGLALFSVQQRTKEIGVRKVLGATVISIAATLSKGFLQLVIVAVVIASPVAYYCMYRWLNGFAYRTNISVWTFVIAGTAAVLIAFFTISFQSIKAAIANPVKSLRTE